MQRGLSKKAISSIKAEIIVTKQSLKAAEALANNLKPPLKEIASDQVCTLNQKLTELNKALSQLKR